ncbi:TetR/AcrR family transcriptional regulator [Streptomyces sp. RTGN2]|uniref:TetR/AcrR family transcriptional regulator n=1 Tax=Streptomyces sp. RTGN2 TaxID=3016525 RepID=UPI002552A83D|nr:TetR/AcrR family transcriptional regulator [Streptomyces sp. RTGN2]
MTSTEGSQGQDDEPSGVTSAGRAPRRDPARNRGRTIDAAREVFAAQGVGAGLNEIAHHAGVGIGTICRHFPDKQVLVDAALGDRFTELTALVDHGLAAATAWEGLTHVMRQAVAMNVADRGLRDIVFSSRHGRRRADALRDGLAPRLEQLLQRAQREGAVRPDLTVADLVMIMLMLTEFAHRSSPVRPDAYSRYLELIISSLRPQSAADDLGVVLSEAEVQQIARQWAGPSR